jgi:hypothetical protein
MSVAWDIKVVRGILQKGFCAMLYTVVYKINRTISVWTTRKRLLRFCG